MMMTMTSILRSAVLAACLGAALACPAQAAAPSQFYTWDPAGLALAKQKVAARDPLYLPSCDSLLKQADAALTHARYSVVDKSLAPASGDKHDFFSFGPYWWPDPARKDGLPYIRKDGLHNPASSTDATDAARIGKFSHDVMVLALAWYFTGEQKYADKAGELARAWFLAPATRMNPNLDYGQAIPGRVDGRGIGIITSRNLIDVMDSLALIQPTGALTDLENEGVRTWYRGYLDWLLNSRNGFEESNAHNNHGTWYGAQVVAYALYTGQPEVAKRELEIARIRRVPGQIDREGKLIAELERSRPSAIWAAMANWRGSTCGSRTKMRTRSGRVTASWRATSTATSGPTRKSMRRKARRMASTSMRCRTCWPRRGRIRTIRCFGRRLAGCCSIIPGS
jgi:hypothetical protein